MDIIVCVKQVPDTTTVIQIDASGKDIVRDGITNIVSPYDEYAIEEALKLSEAHGGTVTVLTVGPDSAKDVLRSGLAMGADNAIHVVTDSAMSLDSLATAKVIAKALEGKSYDMITMGRQAIDDDAMQMGSLLAEILDIAQVTTVVKLDLADAKVTAHRAIEGGTQVIEASLPIVLTAQKGLNTPRYPSMKGILKAKKKPVEIINASDLGLDLQPKVVVEALTLPPARGAGRIVGSVDELVAALTQEIKVI